MARYVSEVREDGKTGLGSFSHVKLDARLGHSRKRAAARRVAEQRGWHGFYITEGTVWHIPDAVTYYEVTAGKPGNRAAGAAHRNGAAHASR